MWLKARETLSRVVDLADELGVTFTLENLNLTVDHPDVPLARAADVLAIVSHINHPRLRINLTCIMRKLAQGT